ncbi:AMP-binding protein [Duncaniella muris]|jgi:long-chain acyl-CoA synthetase|uniref:AMP-binding protein n=1 Tax=Duncaniella muris TaxID=2094150 RepID=UPI001434161C|nr:AMP-binding protein [Duncaniella muris]MCX4259837.1 AMP-binding protein [Muribaculaceae bacterium]GFI06006.1 long-chain-fatty-acid--CoA ligase FadD15 [Muribaculaceae bacterium]
MQESILTLIQQVIRTNWEHLALTDFNGESLQYKDLGRKIAKLHLLFEHTGVKPGDKIAICGKNRSQWAVAFLGTLTYGAVAVPILHEFKPDNIHHLVNHSDARLFFADTSIYENLDPDSMPKLEGAVLIKDFSLLLCRNEKLMHARKHLNEYFGKKYPERFTPDDVDFFKVTDDMQPCIINYTSGSTGFSKGVMLSYRALWSNARFAIDRLKHPSVGESTVCMLPLAHMYGLSIELIACMLKGSHIHFLTRVPSPKVLVEAFQTTRPGLIITVPLVIEKIIKTKVFPTLEKPIMKLLLHTPFIDTKILEKVREQLMQVFGGNLDQMIVGGAALNKDVENFLHEINFPVTVGYGMTECAPLISYAYWTESRPGSCGKPVDRMTVRVDSPDPERIPGEIMVKGDNVMLGYYKNPQATAEVMTPDGWMKTGDMGTIDSDGFIYLRGRNKTMLLGPSGQNIYPEEIEQKLNNMPMVSESLVVDNGDGKLVALIYPDFDEATREQLSHADVKKLMEENIAEVNTMLESYARLSDFRIMTEEFEKTPKRSIKRYLYSKF